MGRSIVSISRLIESKRSTRPIYKSTSEKEVRKEKNKQYKDKEEKYKKDTHNTQRPRRKLPSI